MRTILLFALLFSITLPEHIRAQTVSGYVYDAADGESLVGVTVQVSGSGRGASTNKYGFYSLSLGAGNHQLRFSYLGYETAEKTIDLKSNTTLNLRLKSADNTLNMVVISAAEEKVKETVKSTENYYLVTYSNISDLRGGLSNISDNLFTFNDAKFHVFTDQNNGDGNEIEFKPNLALSAPGDTLVVGLSNITKDYYNFLSAYKRSGNLLSQITAEPISLPSNVQGGYGFFAVIKPNLRLVVIK